MTGIPGGSILPVYDALSQSTQIRHILARHEQGAGFIAQGMARTDGKPAVCMACSGPGATNTVTAIADARLDSIPLICITGQVPASMIGTDAFRGSGHLRHLYPHHQTQLSGQTYRRTPAGHERCLPHCAIRPPRPVWIDIPKDVQTAVLRLKLSPRWQKKPLHPPLAKKAFVTQLQ